MFITLAGILAVIGAVVGAYYFAMRPVTLRIAVGPANSDDLKVVQALTQAFAHARGYVRLRPLQTDGASASAKALADGNADLAIIRGDLDVPKNAQAVATLRKNVAVLWVPPAAKGKQEVRPEDHQNSAARRTPRRCRRPHRGQCQFAQGHPPSVWRRSGQGRHRSISGHRGRGRHPQPEGGRLSRRRTGQQQDHRGCHQRIDARRRYADIPRDRFRRGDRAEPPGLRGIRNSRRRLRRLARQAR